MSPARVTIFCFFQVKLKNVRTTMERKDSLIKLCNFFGVVKAYFMRFVCVVAAFWYIFESVLRWLLLISIYSNVRFSTYNIILAPQSNWNNAIEKKN